MMLSLLLSTLANEEDREKIVTIYKKYFGLMAYTAYQILQKYSSAEVEDIVHSCMVKIIENFDNIDFSNEFKVKAFCITIARNRAIDYMKNKQRGHVEIGEIFTHEVYDENTPENQAVENDTIQKIIEIIDGMSEPDCSILELKYIQGYTEKEIAKLLELSPKVVNMRIQRGKQVLREKIRKELML